MFWRDVPDSRGKNIFKEHAGKAPYDNHAATPNAIHRQTKCTSVLVEPAWQTVMVYRRKSISKCIP